MNLQQMAKEQGGPSSQAKKQATPEQQEQFDLLLGRARQLMAADADIWLQALKASPVTAAVKMGTTLLRHLAQQSEKAGYPIDPVVMMNVGVTMVKDIAGIANDHGIISDDKIEGYLQQVMQESIAEYMRRDADEGLMPSGMGGEEGKVEPKLKGDPSSPDDTATHENAETPSFEKKEMMAEGNAGGNQEPDEEAEMQAQLQALRLKKGIKP